VRAEVEVTIVGSVNYHDQKEKRRPEQNDLDQLFAGIFLRGERGKVAD